MHRLFLYSYSFENREFYQTITVKNGSFVNRLGNSPN